MPATDSPFTLDATGHGLGAAPGSLPLVKLPDTSDREFLGVGGVRPYYDAEGVTIYHGDCLHLLPLLGKKSVDVVVTSPPYNTLAQQVKNNASSRARLNGNGWIKKLFVAYDDSREEVEYQKFVEYVVAMCLNTAQGLVWVNHKLRFRDGRGVHPLHFLRFPLWAEIIWDRGGSMAMSQYRHMQSHEGIWGFGKPHWWDAKLSNLMTVWQLSHQYDDEHPCPFPDRIPKRLISSSCPPGGIVLDPFMGSGTTLIAAKELGRKAIGIEKDERFCELAVSRLRQSVLGLSSGGGGAELPKPSPAEKEANTEVRHGGPDATE